MSHFFIMYSKMTTPAKKISKFEFLRDKISIKFSINGVNDCVKSYEKCSSLNQFIGLGPMKRDTASAGRILVTQWLQWTTVCQK